MGWGGKDDDKGGGEREWDGTGGEERVGLGGSGGS